MSIVWFGESPINVSPQCIENEDIPNS